MMKRIVCMCACLVLMICLFPVTTQAVTMVDRVDVYGVTCPLKGQKPSLDFFIEDSANKGYTVHDELTTEWYDETTGRFLSDTDVFVENHVYSIRIYLEVKSGYEFHVENNKPCVEGSVNGARAYCYKMFEYQAWHTVMLKYTFAPCPARWVETIEISVTEPEAYTSPRYYANSPIADCEIDTSDTAHFQNGVNWSVRKADGRLRDLNGESFMPGEIYYVRFALKPASGNASFNPRTKAYINGKEANFIWASEKYAVVSMEFSCWGLIRGSTINCQAFEPKAGEYPNYDIYYGGGSNHIKDCTWVRWMNHTTNEPVTAEDKFEAGQTYRVEFTLWVENDWRLDVDENGRFIYAPTINGIEPYSYEVGYDSYGREIIYMEQIFTVPGSAGPRGDLNQDGQVNSQDVAYLLWHTLFPGSYPVSGDADYNTDGQVNSQDVAYLLWHTLFPHSYPI